MEGGGGKGGREGEREREGGVFEHRYCRLYT